MVFILNEENERNINERNYYRSGFTQDIEHKEMKEQKMKMKMKWIEYN